MDRKITICEEVKEEMRQRIIDYFYNERNEELGDLASRLILDFFIEELGFYMYNQGIEDAYAYMKDKVEDIFALQTIRRY